MVSKKKRQKKILEILYNKRIYTQEQLTTELEKANYFTTQATISRDMKELGVYKEADKNQKLRYIAPVSIAAKSELEIYYNEEPLCIDYAQNIVVLRGSKEGLICAAKSLEKERKEIVGKVMDDSTLFLLCREVADAEELIRYLMRKDSGK